MVRFGQPIAARPAFARGLRGTRLDRSDQEKRDGKPGQDERAEARMSRGKKHTPDGDQADLRTALSTSVLPSDQIAPGTLWLAAMTESNAVSIQLQSSSVMVSGGSSLMV